MLHTSYYEAQCPLFVSGKHIFCQEDGSVANDQSLSLLFLGCFWFGRNGEREGYAKGYKVCDSTLSTNNTLNPFRTAVPIRGQTSLIPRDLSPKRDWGPKRVNVLSHTRYGSFVRPYAEKNIC